MKLWSIVLELETEEPNEIRDALVQAVREQGINVRSYTIQTDALTAALKHPLMVPDPQRIPSSWMVQATLKRRRNRQGGQ